MCTFKQWPLYGNQVLGVEEALSVPIPSRKLHALLLFSFLFKHKRVSA